MIKREISKGIGVLTPSVWATIVDSTERKSPQRAMSSASKTELFTAKISATAATQISGLAQWLYEFDQVVRTAGASTNAFTVVTWGIKSSTLPIRKAVNIYESANTAVLAMGFAVTSGINITSAPGFSIKPIPPGTVVLMAMHHDTANVLSYEFSAMNPIHGACP